MLKYVFDSYAVLVFYQKEQNSEKILSLLNLAQEKKCEIYLSEINLGVVYYIIIRSSGLESANAILANLRSLPIRTVLPFKDAILQAALYKSSGNISYADAFALQLAVEKKAKLITGDREFKKWEKEVEIEWI